VDVITRLAREFTMGGPSLALPVGNGGTSAEATAANEAVLRLNQAAGNIGKTVIAGKPHALSAVDSHADVLQAIKSVKAGAIVFLHHVDPVYNLPESADAFRGAGEVVSFSSYLDDTTTKCATLVLPDNTPLESWGEYTPRVGTTGTMQPIVTPVFNTRATGDVLLASAIRMGHDLGARTFQEFFRKGHPLDDDAWNAALQKGIIAGGDIPTVTAPNHAGSSSTPSAAGTSATLLHIYPSLHFFDGRSANRPWAQEIPDPVAKAVWGSWAEVHPDLAKRLGASDNDVLSVSTSRGKIELPALITDRVHPQAIAIQLGQGHAEFGRYAKGYGANPMALLSAETEAGSGALIVSGVSVNVTKLPVRRSLAILQTSMKQTGSAIARGITLAGLVRLRKTGKSGEEQAEEAAGASLYANRPKGPHHWGMAIDLDRCVGCNACAAACYSENNIPIAGQDEAGRGREMAWLRIENYEGGPEGGALLQIQPKKASGESKALDYRFLPMLCQQCDNAPCEYVCPVDATVHSADHLNQQVYNRCVGTRYCSNNCPYKVRRFNWKDYEWPYPLDQQTNPDVTRRGRGVMEKCTFCVQRIRSAEVDASADKRQVRDGEIRPACQQSCPAEAIVFGDLNDPNSEVAKLAQDARGYGALSELNTYPNVTYLSRVRAE
jgi:molybdopterin-containing oxidoreductase family iron-sulfur binding subunit